MPQITRSTHDVSKLSTTSCRLGSEADMRRDVARDRWGPRQLRTIFSSPFSYPKRTALAPHVSQATAMRMHLRLWTGVYVVPIVDGKQQRAAKRPEGHMFRNAKHLNLLCLGVTVMTTTWRQTLISMDIACSDLHERIYLLPHTSMGTDGPLPLSLGVHACVG